MLPISQKQLPIRFNPAIAAPDMEIHKLYRSCGTITAAIQTKVGVEPVALIKLPDEAVRAIEERLRVNSVNY